MRDLREKKPRRQANISSRLDGDDCQYVRAKALLQSDINESFIDVDSRNHSSLRGLEKAGCTRVILIHMKRIFASVKYRVTIFDEDAWQRLSETISDYPQKQCVTEEMVNGS